MFGQKLQVQRARRKHGLPFYVVGAFALAIEVMLGINAAFLVDQSLAIVAQNMLGSIAWLAWLAVVAPLLISLIIGACFVGGGMWTFAGFLDNLQDARAYEDAYASWKWPQIMVWLIIIAVIGLDYTTLLFRSAYFAEKGASALFAFFFILILVPFVLGAFMHVLENTPRDRRKVKVERNLEQLDADSYDELLRTMPGHLRSRFLDGDESALTEHYQDVDQQRQDARQQELEAMQQRDDELKRRREAAEAKKRNSSTPASKRTGTF